MNKATKRRIINSSQIEVAKILYGKQNEHISNKHHKWLKRYFNGLFWRYIKLNKYQRKHVHKVWGEMFKIE